MPLTQDQLKALLALPKRAPRGTSKGPNTAVRDVATWFKLPHVMKENEDGTKPLCDNPDCIDPRSKERGQVLVELNDSSNTRICRYCFLAGYLILNPQQQQLTTE